jgi:phage N-6-adenine-methyltransferase
VTEPKQKPGRSKQDYGTPPEFLAAVKKRLRIADFDCDLAATKGNAVTDRYLTVMDDSLSAMTWLRPRALARGWNWLNPPFSNIGAWVQKAHQQSLFCGARTAVLIPAAVGSNWWRDHVHQKAGVLFLNPRLTFVGCEDPYPKDCALLLYDGLHFNYDVWTWKTRAALGAVEGSAAEIPISTQGTAVNGASGESA